MKIFKSHFWYTKNQRNGIFLLLVIVAVLQAVIFFVDFSSKELVGYNVEEVENLQKKIDSLKFVKISEQNKVYPFNPNYISDFKGEQLGMSLQEIDRLITFRKTGKFINSKEEFQKVTKVSDALLNRISPNFKFPDWVVDQNQQKRVSKSNAKRLQSSFNKKLTTTDINKATQEDFKTIYGIGDKISERIIKYRSKLQGFSYQDQLYEVWGLEKEIADKVLKMFKIIEKPLIKKVNVNTASFKEVLKNPYIDYKLCKKIFDYRDEVAELQNINELKNIKDFPIKKYHRIVLYLYAE
jgi:DNA uptake protein ComE-like DNA-binding protein